MTREEIIRGLEFTIEMLLFNPILGETYTEPRNADDKITFDACQGAIELLKQEPFINKPCVSSGVCEHDKNVVLGKIRAEVENINVWGMRYNPDTDKDRKPQIVQKVKEHVIEILDEYKAESEVKDGNDD